MFNKLLDDGINRSIVAVLAYWYCSLQVCLSWQSNISSSFLSVMVRGKVVYFRPHYSVAVSVIF